MKIVTKYILKQMFLGFVLITSGMLGIVWLSQSLKLMEVLLNSQASIFLFIQLTFLMVPSYLSIISPLALFAVTLFTYNRLISDRELVVLRAVGMSPLSLAKPAIILGIIFTVLGFYISLVVVPKSVANFRTLRWNIQNDVSHLLLQEGEFTDVALGVTVYIRNREQDGSLQGIILYDQRSRGGATTVLAEKGALSYKNGVPQVSMINGSRQDVNDKTGRFSILFFDSYTFDFATVTTSGLDRMKNLGEMSIPELFAVTEKDVLTIQSVRRYRVEVYKRLTQPFYNLAFMLIAVAGLLTGNFDRRGHNKRILGTVFVMVFVQIMMLGVENLATRNLAFVPLMFIFALLPIILCLYILKNAGTFSFAWVEKSNSFLQRSYERFFRKRGVSS